MNRRTAKFKKGAEQKRRILATEEEKAVTPRAFSAYGRPLDMVIYFKYLGGVISAADDDWPEVVRNLAKARAVWRKLTRIFSM